MENNNIDDILKDKAFDCMDDKSKQELKELYGTVKERENAGISRTSE